MDEPSTSTRASATRVPILLLKTRSTPTDAYADYFTNLRFTTSHDGQDQTGPPRSDEDDRQIAFPPRNVPVLENRFRVENIQTLEKLLRDGAFGSEGDDGVDDDDVARTAVSATSAASPRKRHYGGLIFTSQRAVEAFVDALRTVVVGNLSFPFARSVHPASFSSSSSSSSSSSLGSLLDMTSLWTMLPCFMEFSP